MFLSLVAFVTFAIFVPFVVPPALRGRFRSVVAHVAAKLFTASASLSNVSKTVTSRVITSRS